MKIIVANPYKMNFWKHNCCAATKSNSAFVYSWLTNGNIYFFTDYFIIYHIILSNTKYVLWRYSRVLWKYLIKWILYWCLKVKARSINTSTYCSWLWSLYLSMECLWPPWSFYFCSRFWQLWGLSPGPCRLSGCLWWLRNRGFSRSRSTVSDLWPHHLGGCPSSWHTRRILDTWSMTMTGKKNIPSRIKELKKNTQCIIQMIKHDNPIT